MRVTDKTKEERKKRQANIKLVIPPPELIVGEPIDVFNNVVQNINSSTQWLEGTPEKRSKIMEKSLVRVMKSNPNWFNNSFPAMVATPSPTLTKLSLQSSTPRRPQLEKQPQQQSAIATLNEERVREFFLARSDVRAEVGPTQVRLVKQKLNTKFPKTVVLSHAGIYKLAELTDQILEEHRQRAEKLRDGYIVSDPDYRELLDRENNVYTAVSCYEGYPLIHVRRYDTSPGSIPSTSRAQNTTQRLIPTKSGVTLTTRALIELKQRIVPLMMNM